MKTALSLIITLLSSSFALGQETQWHTNYDEALKKATADSRPILISFAGSDWCKPCIKLTREVFETENFLSYANENLVLLLLDFPRLKKNKLSKDQQTHNDKLAAKYNNKGEFPLVVVIDADENMLVKSGYQSGGADSYIKFLEKNLNK